MNEAIKINGAEYPATISGNTHDYEWDGRHTKTIALTMAADAARELFVDGVSWSILSDQPIVNPENPEAPMQTTERVEYDNSDFNLAGPITDFRNGSVSVKMGKLTELEEAYKTILGGGV